MHNLVGNHSPRINDKMGAKVARALPASIRPFTSMEKSGAVSTKLADIKTVYGINADSPSLEYSCASGQTSGSGSRKEDLIVGSHAHRLAQKPDMLGVSD